jgi:5-methyltetrahydropteroyltriglutamate--homocysteine methyltransferase
MPHHILTTHVGSLPRGAELSEFLFAAEREEPVDRDRFEAVVVAAVDETVRRQVAAGVDIVSDGEMSKISYATYIKDRISGFAGDTPRRPPVNLEGYSPFRGRAREARHACRLHERRLPRGDRTVPAERLLPE